jgi:hypothetical protein
MEWVQHKVTIRLNSFLLYFEPVPKCSANVKKYSLFVFLDAVEKKIKKISPSSCEIPPDEFIFAVQFRKEHKIVR